MMITNVSTVDDNKRIVERSLQLQLCTSWFSNVVMKCKIACTGFITASNIFDFPIDSNIFASPLSKYQKSGFKM